MVTRQYADVVQDGTLGPCFTFGPDAINWQAHILTVTDYWSHVLLFAVEIQDADTSAEIPVLMTAGDLLVFHSNLRHRSTHNGSERYRAAMIFHYAAAGTEGFVAPNHDWMPVLRGGRAADAAGPVPESHIYGCVRQTLPAAQLLEQSVQGRWDECGLGLIEPGCWLDCGRRATSARGARSADESEGGAERATTSPSRRATGRIG